MFLPSLIGLDNTEHSNPTTVACTVTRNRTPALIVFLYKRIAMLHYGWTEQTVMFISSLRENDWSPLLASSRSFNGLYVL